MSVLDSFSLKGKTALVTGGASILGKPIVLALAEAGAKVIIASRNLDKLEHFAAACQAHQHDVSAHFLDLADEQSITALKQNLSAKSVHIDILVNNASIKKMTGWSDSGKEFFESLKINAVGWFLITRIFGDEMAARGGGSIINIGSNYGMNGPDPLLYEETNIPGYLPDYSYQKGGMLHLTKFIASYYGSKNVRCNSLSPAGVQTDNTPEQFANNYRKLIFLNRMVDPSDLKGPVVFLASDASSFITGVNIPIDGGYSAK